ncbi:MAG: CvpA family protein [Sediminibacterium sp.]|nr:CvpA family protein [Sediminibacterium sp.]
MLIDGLLAIVLLWALFKGYKNGLIVGIFSFAALFIGLAAAVKLSAWAAREAEQHMQWHSPWLPFLAFLAVLVSVIILVRIAAKLIETAMQTLLVGWINTLGGIIMYLLLYGTLFSVVLFYFEKLHIIGPNEIAASKAYPYIHRMGPVAIEALGKLVPFFKGMFAELSDYFGQLPLPA